MRNGNSDGEFIENNITRFIHILRHLGLRISTAEAVDAVNALSIVDILDRRQVQTAFLATLAKSPEDRVILDKAFQAYFTSPEQREERSVKYKQIREEEAREIRSVEDELKYELEGPEQEAKEVSVPLNEEEKKIYAKLPEDKKKKLRDYLKKPFQSNQVNNPEQLINNMIKSSINYWKYYLKFQGDGPPEVDYTGEENTDEILREVVEALRDEEKLLYQDIQKITDTDMPTAAALTAKLSRRLATRISRRYRRSKKRQRPDLRRTIRYNIRYGGTMFTLKYKTKKIQKPKILLICDVSGSMAKYAGFVLQFMYGLSSVTEQIESFIFSEDVERITDELNKTRPFETTMAEIINLSEGWGRGTDFNKALAEIKGTYKRMLTKETFVIIVSDTRTLNIEKAAAGLQDMQKRVKDIIWLNTLPKKIWPDTRSVLVFRRYCRMFECNTLAHLDKIMRGEMMR
ncbi:MAG: vWA domain-containing protein [Eubacteriales bacterium]